MSELPPIWKALLNRNLTEMKNLLDLDSKNANLVYPKNNGSLLDNALTFGYFQEAQMLHSYGGVTRRSPALQQAVFSNNMDLIRWTYGTLDSNLNNKNVAVNSMSATSATETSKTDVVSFLLDSGADPKMFLEMATLTSPAVTKLLVERGVMDLQIFVDNNGRTLLDLLELRKIAHPFTLYLKPDRTNELFVAVSNNDIEALSAGLESGVHNLEEQLSSFVGTVLHYAFSVGATSMAQLLIQKGASPFYVSPKGENCVGAAARSCNSSSIDLARSVVPQNYVNAVYTDKRKSQVSALQQAISRSASVDAVNSLLKMNNGKQGADPNLTCDGVPPAGTLALVIRAPNVPFHHHFDVFNSLVKAGARVDEYIPVLRMSPRQLYMNNVPAFAEQIKNVTL